MTGLPISPSRETGNTDTPSANKVHFSTENDDLSLYGTPKEEIGPANLNISTSR